MSPLLHGIIIVRRGQPYIGFSAGAALGVMRLLYDIIVCLQYEIIVILHYCMIVCLHKDADKIR